MRSGEVARAPRGVSRRTFLKAIGAAAPLARSLAAGADVPAAPATLYNGIRLRTLAARSPRFRLKRPGGAPTGCSARGHSDRRRPAVVRRRFPDRRHLARRGRSTGQNIHGQPGPPANHARGKIRRVRRADEDALESRRDGFQRRRLLRPPIACSRCGTWPATAPERAMPLPRRRRHWDKPALDVVPGTNLVQDRGSGTRVPFGSIHRRGLGRERLKMAYYANDLLYLFDVAGRHPLERSTPQARGTAIARRSFTIRSASPFGCSACRNPDSGIRFRRYVDVAEYRARAGIVRATASRPDRVGRSEREERRAGGGGRWP